MNFTELVPVFLSGKAPSALPFPFRARSASPMKPIIRLNPGVFRRLAGIVFLVAQATIWGGAAAAHTGGSTAYADIVVSERAVRFKIALPTATLPAGLKPEAGPPVAAGAVVPPGGVPASSSTSPASPASPTSPTSATPPLQPASTQPTATGATPPAVPTADLGASNSDAAGVAASAAMKGHPGAPSATAGAPVAAEQARAAAALLAAVRDGVTVLHDGERCAPGGGLVQGLDAAAHTVTLVIDYDCREPIRHLVVRDGLFDALGKDHLCLAKVEFPGGMQQFAFAADNRELKLGLGKDDEAAGGALSFLALGVEHILTGWDHLLFLLALMLCGGNLWSLFKIVTAFTLAHSITLALAALDVVNLPSRWVEAAIAASIAYVAAENLFLGGRISRRWMVSFVFGLVHGFGFSAALRELDLNRSGLVLSLLNFNLGVEAGQALVVAVTVPFLLKLRRTAWEPRVVRALSTATLLVGLALFVERAFF